MSWTSLAQRERVAGVLRGPKTLYDNVTRTAANGVRRVLPASKGELEDYKDEVEDYKGEVENYKAQSDERSAQLEKYRNETTGIINALVGKINGLTPVGTHL